MTRNQAEQIVAERLSVGYFFIWFFGLLMGSIPILMSHAFYGIGLITIPIGSVVLIGILIGISLEFRSWVKSEFIKEYGD